MVGMQELPRFDFQTFRDAFDGRELQASAVLCLNRLKMPVGDTDSLCRFLLCEAHSQAQVTQVFLKCFESRHATIIAFRLEALHATHVACSRRLCVGES